MDDLGWISDNYETYIKLDIRMLHGAPGRSRWLRRKILLLPIFESLIDGADLPDGAEELFATSSALDWQLHAPARKSAAFKSVRLLDNRRPQAFRGNLRL